MNECSKTPGDGHCGIVRLVNVPYHYDAEVVSVVVAVFAAEAAVTITKILFIMAIMAREMHTGACCFCRWKLSAEEH